MVKSLLFVWNKRMISNIRFIVLWTTKLYNKNIFGRIQSMSEERYNIVLGGTYARKTGEKDYLTVPFSFKNEELFLLHEGSLFDMLIEKFNGWLRSHDHAEWFLDECPESDREFQGGEEDCVMIWILFFVKGKKLSCIYLIRYETIYRT